jgi:predicted nucleic acid-binding protein
MKKKSLLDAYAILNFFKKEPNFSIVKNLLTSAHKGHATLLMNQINAGEVYYEVAKQNLTHDMERFWNGFLQLPITFIENDFDLVIEAAKIKAQYSIPYADAFAVATAIKEKAAIITGDPDFKKVKKIVEIQWL